MGDASPCAAADSKLSEGAGREAEPGGGVRCNPGARLPSGSAYMTCSREEKMTACREITDRCHRSASPQKKPRPRLTVSVCHQNAGWHISIVRNFAVACQD